MIEKFMNSISTVSSFIGSYPTWVKILFACWATVTLFLILGLILAPRSGYIPSDTGTQRGTKPTERTPPSKPVEDKPQATVEPLPNFIMAESVEKLREKQGVRPMRDTENELSLYHISKGVFGWVESYKLNSPRIWMEGSLFGPDHRVLPMSTKLSQKRRYTNEVEIHKSDSGTVSVVVFVSDEPRMQLEDPSRRDATRIVVVFRLYKTYHQPIAIPRERLEYWESRSFGDNEPVADVWIA
jgi:hypothetical protein